MAEIERKAMPKVPSDMMVEVEGARYAVHWHRWGNTTVCLIRCEGKLKENARIAEGDAVRNPQDVEDSDKGVRLAAKRACALAEWNWGDKGTLDTALYSAIRRELGRREHPLDMAMYEAVKDLRGRNCCAVVVMP